MLGFAEGTMVGILGWGLRIVVGWLSRGSVRGSYLFLVYWVVSLAQSAVDVPLK